MAMALALRRLRGQPGKPLLRSFTFQMGSPEDEGSAVMALWGWGRGDAGQLGSPAESLRSRPHLIASFNAPPSLCFLGSRNASTEFPTLQEEDDSLQSLQSESYFALSCGLYHSALVLGGELWIWGKGDGGRLGLGSEESHFKPVQNPHIQGVRSISLGGLHSAAVTRNGELYTWVEAIVAVCKKRWDWFHKPIHAVSHILHLLWRNPSQYEDDKLTQGWFAYLSMFEPDVNIQVTMNEELILFRNQQKTFGYPATKVREGMLKFVSWWEAYGACTPYLQRLALRVLSQVCRGYGGFGALGHGCYTRELLPRKVQFEEKEEIVYVSTGGAHTAAITSKGDLYCWGRDEGEGRLGHGSGLYTDEGVVSVPLMVDAIGSPVASVSCGGFFTVALTRDGQLWSWGANNNDELGREHAHGSKPSPIPYNENTRIVQVACGGFHSVALTEGGKVLTWGHGGHGQLGHNLLTNEKAPRLVESLADAHVIHVACGSSWTAAVTDVGDLYCWGKNRDSQLGAPADAPDICPIPTRACFDTSLSERTSVISVAAGAHHGLCLSIMPEV